MDTPTTPTPSAPARASFTRVTNDPKHITALVREAKRVGYTVKTDAGFSHVVTDHTDGNAGALVFRAVQVRRGLWAVTYATAYWQEPPMPAPAP